MIVLVYVEQDKGKFKKVAYEAVTYGFKTAEKMGLSCVALVVGQAEDIGLLGHYGAKQVIHLRGEQYHHFDSQVYAAAIGQVALETEASVIILPHNSTGKSLLGRLSVRLGAGSVSAVSELPTVGSAFIVRRPVFSGKAFAQIEIKTPVKLISLAGNSLAPEKISNEQAVVTQREVATPLSKIIVKSVEKTGGRAPLPEAELVVSAGRGLKGPENWGIIEELAEALGATTACSRPVADSGWRPHHEHVGQTGIAVKPNLYIAVGISGAIQHLAGVNNSKVIVVINKDLEAPFFKAADYGVCGDLFEVIPRLTAAVKKLKA